MVVPNMLRILGVLIIGGGIYLFLEIQKIETSYPILGLISTDLATMLLMTKVLFSIIVLAGSLVNGIMFIVMAQLYKRQMACE